jgi:hypothetical protein
MLLSLSIRIVKELYSLLVALVAWVSGDKVDFWDALSLSLVTQQKPKHA